MDNTDDRLQYSNNGYTYTLKLAPGRLSLRCGLRVAAVLAPVMGGLAKLKKADGAFAASMVYLFTNPALEDIVLSLVDTFAPYTEVNVDGAMPPQSFTLSGTGTRGPWIDVHFAGRQDALLDWLGHACKQNLASFLGGLLAKAREAEAALEALKKSSESPNPAEASG